MYAGDEFYGDDITSPTMRPNTIHPLAREDEHPLPNPKLLIARKQAWEAYNNAPASSPDHDALLDAALAAQRAYDKDFNDWYQVNKVTDPGVQGQYRTKQTRKRK